MSLSLSSCSAKKNEPVLWIALRCHQEAATSRRAACLLESQWDLRRSSHGLSQERPLEKKGGDRKHDGIQDDWRSLWIVLVGFELLWLFFEFLCLLGWEKQLSRRFCLGLVDHLPSLWWTDNCLRPKATPSGDFHQDSRRFAAKGSPGRWCRSLGKGWEESELIEATQRNTPSLPLTSWLWMRKNNV